MRDASALVVLTLVSWLGCDGSVATPDAPSPDAPAAGCAPPAEAGSFYATSAPLFGTGEDMSMCDFRGDVVLIVNTATLDGFAPQLAALQVLEETFAVDGFHVLGFTSDDFGNQGGTDLDIEMATALYGVTFAQFQKARVSNPAPQPVWAWILAQPNPGPAPWIDPTWNFHKYLLARDGTLIGHWDQSVYPGDDPGNSGDTFDGNAIVVAIRAAL